MTNHHPLVGKKLVKSNPEPGEITEHQLKDSFESLTVNRLHTWKIDNPGARWQISVDSQNIITEVMRT